MNRNENATADQGEIVSLLRDDSKTAGTTHTLSEQQLDQVSGGLSPTGTLTADGHVSFTPDGRQLVVTIKD